MTKHYKDDPDGQDIHGFYDFDPKVDIKPVRFDGLCRPPQEEDYMPKSFSPGSRLPAKPKLPPVEKDPKDPNDKDAFPEYKPEVKVYSITSEKDENSTELASEQELHAIQELKNNHPEFFSDVKTKTKAYPRPPEMVVATHAFHPEEAWIQTYSGIRFNPTKPIAKAICIQDIAHSLSMQCRFSGHCNQFYSVAQHSVLVSHACNFEDALWGLLHDASEAYLVDVPRPLKRSGKFDSYLEYEKKVQEAICNRFGLEIQEPPSVKKADAILLATEARDLMSPLRNDWEELSEPLPFKIDPLPPKEAKDLFIKRFFKLIGSEGYKAYYSFDINRI